MPIIYFVLTQTGTLPSKVFKCVTREPYNHLSISLTKELTQLYSFARRDPYNMLNAGFIQECVRTGTYSRFPQTKCEIYQFEISEQRYDQLTQLIAYFNDHHQAYSYNFLGLLLIYFEIILTRECHYVCSQFVAFLLNQLKVSLPKPYQVFKPIDIRQVEGVELIYKGLLREYPEARPAIFDTGETVYNQESQMVSI